MKRNLIIIVIVILALLAGVFYFTKEKDFYFQETSVYTAIPVSAPAFLKINSLKSIPLDNPFIREVLESAEIEMFTKADSIIKTNKNIQSSLRNDPFILVLGLVGENDLFPLIIKSAESKGKRKALENLAREMYSPSETTMEEIDYSGHKIFAVTSDHNNRSFYFCFTNGLYLASSKILLVEQSIRQLNARSLIENPHFSRVNKTVNSDSEISWFINHKSFPDIIAGLTNRKSFISPNEFGQTNSKNYTRSVRGLKHFAAWSELDIQIDKNKILLNGVSAINDSINHFLKVFRQQQPVSFRADEVLPQNTSFFTSFNFSDKILFFKNLENYFTLTDSYYKREDHIKKIEYDFRIDFRNTFQQLVKNEIIVAAGNIPDDPALKTTFFILQTEGKSDAENQLNSMLNSYAERNGIEINTLKSIYSIDNETLFSIYKFPFPSFPGIWLGMPFGFAEANFAAFNGNFLVFCNSETGLQEYLYSMVLDATLSKDLNYKQFKQNTESKTNLNTYVNVSAAFNMRKEIFNEEISKSLEKNENLIEKITAINWQIINEKEMFFNSMFLSFKGEYIENSEETIPTGNEQTVWQSNIGASIISKPALVVNHTDKDNLEIILTDEKNNLQLLTKDGRIRWKISLEEKPLSEIHQIDYSGNGNLQYFFNTRSKLYLIDRNGNNVSPFPVSLRSPATNGVSVFDYENNRKYRFFVAGEDKKIYAYDKTGNILSGWDFEKTDFPVSTPVQHFRVSGKDYLVFKDKSRIYIQNRKGETRVTTTAKFENSQNPLVLNLNGTPKMAATDKNGKVFYLYFDGKFTEINAGKFSENHFFNMDDLNGDGTPEFVFTDGKELTVLNEKGEKLFSEKFKNQIKTPPGIYNFNAKLKKIGVTDESANLIYLYDYSGKLHKGFPLPGNGDFSIGKISKSSNQHNLIVGSKGGNLYNYSLK